jgi:hypothetical protein
VASWPSNSVLVFGNFGTPTLDMLGFSGLPLSYARFARVLTLGCYGISLVAVPTGRQAAMRRAKKSNSGKASRFDGWGKC